MFGEEARRISPYVRDVLYFTHGHYGERTGHEFPFRRAHGDPLERMWTDILKPWIIKEISDEPDVVSDKNAQYRAGIQNDYKNWMWVVVEQYIETCTKKGLEPLVSIKRERMSTFYSDMARVWDTLGTTLFLNLSIEDEEGVRHLALLIDAFESWCKSNDNPGLRYY